MKVWWCFNPPYDEFEWFPEPEEVRAWCEAARVRFKTGRFQSPKLAALHEKCGPMRLIPDNAETLLIALIADGTLIPSPDPEKHNWYMWTGRTSGT